MKTLSILDYMSGTVSIVYFPNDNEVGDSNMIKFMKDKGLNSNATSYMITEGFVPIHVVMVKPDGTLAE